MNEWVIYGCMCAECALCMMCVCVCGLSFFCMHTSLYIVHSKNGFALFLVLFVSVSHPESVTSSYAARLSMMMPMLTKTTTAATRTTKSVSDTWQTTNGKHGSRKEMQWHRCCLTVFVCLCVAKTMMEPKHFPSIDVAYCWVWSLSLCLVSMPEQRHVCACICAFDDACICVHIFISKWYVLCISECCDMSMRTELVCGIENHNK